MKRLTTVIAVSLIIAAPAVWANGSENQQGMNNQMQQNSGQDHHELMEEHMERM